MTPEELAAIEQRANVATAGPWEHIQIESPEGWYDGVPYSMPVINGAMSDDDVAFIAAARADVPALIAALRQAWADRDHARYVVNWYHALADRKFVSNPTELDRLDRLRIVSEDTLGALPGATDGWTVGQEVAT